MVIYGLFAGRIVEKMTKLYALTDVLPIYKYENEMQDEYNSVDWIAEQSELGEYGEKIIKKFLKERYQAIVNKKPDYAGYDFEVTIKNHNFVVEVKTTENHINQFFISSNELKKAAEIKGNYYIYRLYIHDRIGRLFVIRDPISLLNIDKTLLETFVENERICARIDGLAISLKEEFIKKLPIIDIDL